MAGWTMTDERDFTLLRGKQNRKMNESSDSTSTLR